MPNHITSILTVDRDFDEIKKFVRGIGESTDLVTGEVRKFDQLFDFNKITPMPEELRGTRSPAVLVTPALYLLLKAEGKLDGKITKSMSKKWKLEFGADNWYDWALEHWGTKWNAYDVSVLDNGFRLDTAWAGIPDLIGKLSQSFPDTTFTLEWADEDIGQNTGSMIIKNGDLIKDNSVPNGSDEAYEQAIRLKGMEGEFVKVGDNWGWAEEFEDEKKSEKDLTKVNS